ncbi:MAG TPA: sortase [Candidatus Saccharibacteria bacterium]|nr:sortase [Candidatus Saccharibacteria bacterium]HRK94180.1 sortase [Candidatus Saccharibacteria bacterium]
MRPDDRQIQSGDPRGQIQPPARSHDGAQEAVANIARDQIDSIYAGDPQQPSEQDAYHRTHQPAHSIQANQWQQYHSAWQNYYQKYYERYYVGAVQQAHNAYQSKVSELQQATPEPEATPQPIGSHSAAAEPTIGRDEAMYDLRSQLIDKLQTSGKKVRRSRHFIPIVSALIVLLLFSFLQYNRVIISNVKAYVTPGEIDPQNIVVDPNASLQVPDDPLLIIPKINVNVPVVYDTKPDQASQLKAMENGVAYFGIPGADSKPGQIGNTVISGHSSNDFIDSGNYKFVFALLERLKKGDIFYLHYNGIRYTYSVTGTRVVKPNDVQALVYETDKPVVTLITCTPLGTALNRLLVTAEQVSPNPAAASAAPTDSGESDEAVMPGNSPTILERIFGG